MRTCTLCFKVFTCNSSYFRHLDSHSFFGGFFCDLCEKNFRREENLIEHWRKACPGIQMFLTSKEQQNMPYQQFKLFVIRNIYEYKKVGDVDKPSTSNMDCNDAKMKLCEHCNSLMPMSTFGRHSQVHHKVIKPGEESVVDKDVYKIHYCDLCGLIFESSNCLYNHWRQNCNEVLANVPENGVLLSDEELVDLVAHLVDESDLQKITDSKFQFAHHKNQSHHLVKPDPWVNSAIWQNNSTNLINCPRCLRKFKNKGRLDRHLLAYHNTWKTREKCSLCSTSFKRKDALIEHLRSVCPAMKLEVPEKSERASMKSFELVKKMGDCEPRWNKINEARRNEYQSYVRQVLNIREDEPTTSLHPSELPELPDFSVTSLVCPFCDIMFKNTDITKRHIISLHPEKVKNFIDGTPVFFDEFGYEYRLGKYLNTSMKHGTRLKKILPDGTFEFAMAVEIICRDIGQRRCVILNEIEIPMVFGNQIDSKLKFLYEYKPTGLEDLPILKQEE